jgi:predicted nucleotidyltransferase
LTLRIYAPKAAIVNPSLDDVLKRAVGALKSEVGANLYSCCLYGSAVRGNAIEGVSDVNLLIVLNESNSTAHQAIGRALEAVPQVDPFVLARRGFERSVRAFAPKFASIRRNYRVLHGTDPLATITIDATLERFLCEQALRNLRLRLAYSFITRRRHKNYDRFVTRNVTALFVQVSEVLRLQGVAVPTDFEARIPLFERELKIDSAVLRDLLELKRAARRLSEAETVQWHDRLFPVVDAVLHGIEERWPA